MKVSIWSRFITKSLEVIGAGLASAFGAFLLGHMGSTPPADTAAAKAPPTEVVHVIEDKEALVSELRREIAAKPDPTPEVAAVPVPLPKVKAASAPASRTAKQGRPQTTEAKARPVETAPPAQQTVQPQPPAQASLSQPATPQPVVSPPPQAATQPLPPPVVIESAPPQSLLPPPAAEAATESHGVFGWVREIPDRLRPSTERIFGNVPRPPMPVGEFLPGEM